jgi:hypothetical protein
VLFHCLLDCHVFWRETNCLFYGGWLKGYWGRSLVIKVSSLLFRCYEVRSLFYHILQAIMFFLTTGWKSIDSADHGLKPLKWWSQIIFPPYKLMMLGILSHYGDLSVTESWRRKIGSFVWLYLMMWFRTYRIGLKKELGKGWRCGSEKTYNSVNGA